MGNFAQVREVSLFETELFAIVAGQYSEQWSYKYLSKVDLSIWKDFQWVLRKGKLEKFGN